MYRTLRTNELRKISETNHTAASILSSANTIFVPTAPERRVFRKHISDTSDSWKNVDNTWQLEISQAEHGFKEIQDLIVERKMLDGSYKNILYSYNIYNKDTLVITVDYKINIRVTLFGIDNILEIPDEPEEPDIPEEPPDEPELPDIPEGPNIDAQLQNLTFRVEDGVLSVTYPDNYDITSFGLSGNRLYAFIKEGYPAPNLRLENNKLILVTEGE